MLKKSEFLGKLKFYVVDMAGTIMFVAIVVDATRRELMLLLFR